MADLGWPAAYDDDGNPVDMLADPLPDEPKTELGYARRLIAVYGDRLRYVPAWRRWLRWDGARWAHDSTGQAARWMKAIARRLTADALAIEDDKKRAAALSAARRGESSYAIAGALTLASTETEIAVSPGDLDADPYLLNCANGTLDLRTMELRGHDPADLLTKVTRAAWHPDAASQEWDGFLARVQPDEAMRRYLARLTGHALEGRVTEHVLSVHYGAGANGKTTFAEAVAYALGDYAGPADPELLTARTFDAHPTGTADLFGVRLAVLHETDQGRRLAEATVKRLTGGDRIKARRMREDFWSFEPSHMFVMLTNHRPIIGGTDDGIWRRVRLVPWEVQIPADEQDSDLGDRLRLTADAVLRFLVDGYAHWRGHGLDDPEQVVKATEAWRGESDALGRFIADRCLAGPHFYAKSGELFAAWCEWCRAGNEEPGTQTAFSLELGRLLGHGTRHSATGKVWDGLALATRPDDGFDESEALRLRARRGQPRNPSNPSQVPLDEDDDPDDDDPDGWEAPF
jgi:putative DNA primase/helicase